MKKTFKSKLTAKKLLRHIPTDAQPFYHINTGGYGVQFQYEDYKINALSYGNEDYVTHISQFQQNTLEYAVIQKIYGDEAKQIYDHAKQYCK